MVNEFKEWVENVLGADYAYSMGQWVESSSIDSKRYCVIIPNGGMAPILDMRQPRYRILLIGKRNDRSEGMKVLNDANRLVLEGINGDRPCGAANVRATAEPIGPGFTAENRAWAEVNFEILY